MKISPTISLTTILLYLIMLFLASIRPTFSTLAASPTPVSPVEVTHLDESEIEQAIYSVIEGERRLIPAYLLFDTLVERITISEDGLWATAWLVPLDPQTGRIIPTEPGLVILQKTEDIWQAFLPSHPDWVSYFAYLPPELLSSDVQTTWLIMSTSRVASIPLATYTGYKLPWEGGKTLAMTQSVAHDKYTESGTAHYSFDFATAGTAQMFNIHAAKAGTVKFIKDTCTNGDPNCSNWIVLEDTATSPTTYQLYLHLAQGSIPSQLRTIGTSVYQGQFIGIADDTGMSTAHHLHFMVHTTPTSYWGTSVDITFSDVSINGGRPRITTDQPYCKNDSTYQDVCVSFISTYVSGNYPNTTDTTPPYGDILEPNNAISFETTSLNLEGWANDAGSGLNYAQFIAKYDGAWHNIGNPFTTIHFSYTWDLCSDNLTDDPISIALLIQDNAGNLAEGLPGLRQIVKNSSCPAQPPVCSPGDDQIALFTSPNFQGTCQLFTTGNYSSTVNFGAIGDNQVASIQVGSNVLPTLYYNSDYRVRGETFTTDDSYLSDNLIGSSTTSSMIVRTRSTSPLCPRLIWPETDNTFPANSSLSLSWDNGESNQEYQAKLYKNGTLLLTSDWQKLPYLQLDSLSTGNYTWQVRSKNNSSTSTWSDTKAFTIQTTSPSTPPPVPLPFTDDMENGMVNWIRSTYWDTTTTRNHTPSGDTSWFYDVNMKPSDGYDTGTPNTGDMTSAPFPVPSSGEYYLRFWYYYQTEGKGKYRDQRKIQVSVDGGAFTDILQLSDDPTENWLQSPAISLSPYAGKTIQIRFHFETLDKYLNRYLGWYIDDFSITSTPPASCPTSNEPNNTFGQATHISYNTSTIAEICPGGDMDYYMFDGHQGDHIGIWVQGVSSLAGSVLDPYLYLLDSDGVAILAENDDQILGQQTDSLIQYNLPNTSQYYLVVRAWEHPTAGGSNYQYKLNLYNDQTQPNASFAYPLTGSQIPHANIHLAVNTSDGQSGVSHIVFYWHSSEWFSEDWVQFGEDWESGDGWGISFDMSALSAQGNMAFYAVVYDFAGNQRSIGTWNLSNDTFLTFFPVIRK